MLCGICGGKNVTGTGFLRVLELLLTIAIPSDIPHYLPSGRGTIGPLVAGA
jgi:hypothetical protein